MSTQTVYGNQQVETGMKKRISDFWSAQPIGFTSYIVGTRPRIRNGMVYWRITGEILEERKIKADFRWSIQDIAHSRVTLLDRMNYAWNETYKQAFAMAKEASERERTYLRYAPKGRP